MNYSMVKKAEEIEAQKEKFILDKSNFEMPLIIGGLDVLAFHSKYWGDKDFNKRLNLYKFRPYK